MLAPGAYTVAPTPFREDGSVDLDSVTSMTQQLIELGVDGLLILGVMGEANKLLDEERQAVLARFVNAAEGKASIIVGTNHAGSIPARELAKRAEQAGAQAVMISPPPLAKPSEEAIAGFFGTIAAGSEIEIVLQDHPAASGVQMTPETIHRLFAEVNQLTSLKLEDPPTPPKVSLVVDLIPAIQVFGGLGGLKLVEELDRGSVGTMTGFAYPEVLKRIVRLHQAGDVTGARSLFEQFLPLILFESQPIISLAIRKRLYVKRGFITHHYVRGPAPAVDRGTATELDRLVSTVSLANLST